MSKQKKSRVYKSKKSRKPRSKKSRKPRSKKSRKPRYKKSRKPRSKKSRKPRSKKSRKPRSKKSRKPRSKKSRKPRSKKSRKPRSKKYDYYTGENTLKQISKGLKSLYDKAVEYSPSAPSGLTGFLYNNKQYLKKRIKRGRNINIFKKNNYKEKNTVNDAIDMLLNLAAEKENKSGQYEQDLRDYITQIPKIKGYVGKNWYVKNNLLTSFENINRALYYINNEKSTATDKEKAKWEKKKDKEVQNLKELQKEFPLNDLIGGNPLGQDATTTPVSVG
jgi:hypothetical protein